MGAINLCLKDSMAIHEEELSMAIETVEINVPKDMKIYVSAYDEKTELTINALMLYPYIKVLTISHGRAAEILGIGKMELIELYAVWDAGNPLKSRVSGDFLLLKRRAYMRRNGRISKTSASFPVNSRSILPPGLFMLHPAAF